MRFLPAATAALIVSASGVAADSAAHRVVREEASSFGRTVDVAIERPIAEAQMAAIASDLAVKTTAKGRRTFVNFYLPGMKAGEAPWASVTHTNDIPVRIDAGLGSQDADGTWAAMGRDALAGTGDIAVSWTIAWPEAGERIVIARRGGRLSATAITKDGTRKVDELAEATSLRGRRLDVMRSATGEHFILRPDGSIERHARSGLQAKGAQSGDVAATVPEVAGTAMRVASVEPTPPALTATGISIIEPWPQTGRSTLAVARSVLTEVPAKHVLVSSAEMEAKPAASERSATVRPTTVARSEAGASDQSRVWQSLSRFLAPRD